MDLPGFSLAEVGADHLRRRMLRGGFPRSYLAPSDVASFGWREDFIRTFIERDLPSLGERIQSPVNLRRLWTMLAHRHAQVWNGAALAAALGESYPTVKRHLDLLTGTLVVRHSGGLPNNRPRQQRRGRAPAFGRVFPIAACIQYE